MNNENKIRMRNLTLLLGGTLTVMAAATLSPALPAIKQAFQDVPNVDILVRLVLTIPALFIALSAPVSGVLLDRWGRKPVLILMLIVYAFAGASGFVLQSLTGIIIGRALLGLAVAGVMSGFTTLIGDYFSGQKLNQFMGYQAAVVGFGGVIYIMAGGMLADVGWRYPFLIYLFSFLVLIGVIFTINEPEIETSQEKLTGDTAVIPLKTVFLIYGVAFFSMILFYITPVQLPFYLTAVTDISSSQVGLALALQALTAAIISLQYQRAKARFSYWTITSIIFFFLGIGNLFIGGSASYLIVVTGLIVSGIGLGFLIPNLNVWLISIVPAEFRGRAVGGLTMSIFLGQFISPIVSQPVTQQVDLAGTFTTAGFVALLIALLFAVGNKRKKSTRVAPVEIGD